MEIRTLKYFLAIAEAESFSAAGQNVLFVTQPTLSRQMQELEEELGVKLFYRAGQKTLLTQEGIRFKQRAEEIMTLVKRTEQEFSSSKNEEIAGDIYIGCAETEGMRKVIRIIKNLQSQFPKIRIHLYSGNASNVSEKLDQGILDFGVLLTSANFFKYNFLNLSERDVWGLLVRKDHPLAQKESITPDDLLDVPLIVSQQSMQFKDFSGWLGRDLDSLHVVASYNLIFNAALMVDEALGVAITLDKLVHTSENSRLCFRPFSPKQETELQLVWKKQQAMSKVCEIFLDAFRKWS